MVLRALAAAGTVALLSAAAFLLGRYGAKTPPRDRVSTEATSPAGAGAPDAVALPETTRPADPPLGSEAPVASGAPTAPAASSSRAAKPGGGVWRAPRPSSNSPALPTKILERAFGARRD